MRAPKDHEGEIADMFPRARPEHVRIADAIAELERELHMRERIYPKWIEAGKMDPEMAAARLLYVDAAIRGLKMFANTCTLFSDLEQYDPEGLDDEKPSRQTEKDRADPAA